MIRNCSRIVVIVQLCEQSQAIGADSDKYLDCRNTSRKEVFEHVFFLNFTAF